MEHTSVVQLDLHNSSDEEVASSDDSEVRVANMNGHCDIVAAAVEEDSEEKSNSTNVEGENEIVSDDEYRYSEDSIYSDDSRDSEVTNVTPRSSLSAGSPLNRTMSLEYPARRRVEEIERGESTPPRQRFENGRENLLRMCASASDNRYSINNEPRLQQLHRRPRRRNMSFTNAEMREIERNNQFLLKKIMAQQKPQNKPMRVQSAQPKVSSSAINRRKLQKKIEEENMMILRRIQGVKSCAVNTNATPGYRVTSL